MNELMFQAGVKGMSERSELIPCISIYIYTCKFLWTLADRYTEDYGKYPIFPDIWEIKRMRKQCLPGVPPPPRTPGYEANCHYRNLRVEYYQYT